MAGVSEDLVSFAKMVRLDGPLPKIEFLANSGRESKYQWQGQLTCLRLDELSVTAHRRQTAKMIAKLKIHQASPIFALTHHFTAPVANRYHFILPSLYLTWVVLEYHQLRPRLRILTGVATTVTISSIGLRMMSNLYLHQASRPLVEQMLRVRAGEEKTSQTKLDLVSQDANLLSLQTFLGEEVRVVIGEREEAEYQEGRLTLRLSEKCLARTPQYLLREWAAKIIMKARLGMNPNNLGVEDYVDWSFTQPIWGMGIFFSGFAGSPLMFMVFASAYCYAGLSQGRTARQHSKYLTLSHQAIDYLNEAYPID